jgi:hypothetical protein
VRTFEDGLEAAARTLEFLATGHALDIAGEYTWLDRPTLVAAAKAIRAANGITTPTTPLRGDEP